MRNPLLPKAQAGFLDGAGRPLAEWRRFFESLSALTTETTLQAEIGAILARIGALESGGPGSVVGASSIVTYGDLTSGLTVTLSGDVSNPGASFNYGTDALGEKGWQTRTLADTGIGAALVRITRDAFGRVEGTQAATTADLTEGTNLYYTNERAQDATAAALAAGTHSGISFVYDDAGNKISATVTAGSGAPAVAIPVIAGVATLDWSAGEFFTLSLTANATLAFINPPAAGCVILRLTQTGAFALTMPASVTAIGPAYTTTQTQNGTERIGLLTVNTGSSYDLVKG